MLSKFLLALFAALALASNDTNSTNSSASPSANSTGSDSGAAANATGSSGAAAANATGSSSAAAAGSSSAAAAAGSSSAAAAAGSSSAAAAAGSSSAAAAAGSSSAAAAGGSAAGGDGHEHDSNSTVPDATQAGATKLSAAVALTYSGVSANVTSNCKASTGFKNIALMAAMAAIVSTADIDNAKLCDATGALPMCPGATLCHTCLGRDEPTISGLDSGDAFSTTTKMYSSATCARLLSQKRRRLSGSEVSINDAPTIVVSQQMMQANAAGVAATKALFTGDAALTAFQTKVETNSATIAKVLSGAGTAADSTAFATMFAAMPTQQDATTGATTAVSYADLSGDATTANTLAGAQADMQTGAAGSSAATVAAVAQPMSEETMGSTSGAAEFFLSFVTLAGAALLW